MAEKKRKSSDEETGSTAGEGVGTATAKPKKAKGGGTATKPAPKKDPPGLLPPWKVLLHNDNKNDMPFVIGTVVELTPLNKQEAELRTKEAHRTGVALLLTTHKERAELYQDQFQSKGLTVSIEPAAEG